mmetsp:Transcript_6691/g.9855  ORF Transcript_6691/g.9855 Transcript_6691/m.9855 type:complete len:459 (+) Transcript_6691:79-1455(+)
MRQRDSSTQSSLKCIETLRAPKNSTKKSISKTDSILSSYIYKHDTDSDAPVWHCTFSSDGIILATCHGKPDPCVRLWKHKMNESTGEKSWTLTATLREEVEAGGSSSAVRTIRSAEFAPTPDGVRKILACASFDGSISIWEDFSSDSDGRKDEYKSDSDRLDNGDEHEGSASGKSDTQNTACGWECTAQLEGHENEVKDVSWNATGTLLASCGRDKSVWIWECFLPGTIGGDGNGSTGVSGGDGDFECLAVLQTHTGDVKKVKFAPSHGQFGDGDEILLSASYDDTIKVWAEDAGDWYCALTLTSVHISTIWDIAIASGGVRMVSGSADESLAIWRCYTASEKQDFEDPSDKDDGMHTDGCWKCVGKLPSAHSQPIYTVDCAPSRAGHGRIVSGGGDDKINIYREVGGTSDAPIFDVETCANKAHNGDINCVKWHPIDGRTIVSAGDDGIVKIWNFVM